MKKFISGVVGGALLMLGTSVFAEDGLRKIEAYVRSGLPITLDGNKVTLESPAVMVDGNTYLKLRDVAKLTGLGVNWNEVSQTVEMITYGNIPSPTPPVVVTPSPTPVENKPSKVNLDKISAKPNGTYLPIVKDKFDYIIGNDSHNQTKIIGDLEGISIASIMAAHPLAFFEPTYSKGKLTKISLYKRDPASANTSNIDTNRELLTDSVPYLIDTGELYIDVDYFIENIKSMFN